MSVYYLQYGDRFLLKTGLIVTVLNFEYNKNNELTAILSSKELRVTKELNRIATQLKKFYD